MQTKRGGFLTTMAVLLALVAIEDVLKPFGRQGPTIPVSFLPRIQPGIVVLGVRYTGSEAAILGPLVAAVLVLYTIGIWRMKRYAVTVAWIYAVYVILNLTLFMIRNPPPPTRGETIFGIGYSIVAIVLTVGTALALTRRRADLT
jgi:hypothetical protein